MGRAPEVSTEEMDRAVAASGIGREYGEAGIAAFTETKSVGLAG